MIKKKKSDLGLCPRVHLVFYRFFSATDILCMCSILHIQSVNIIAM